MFFRLPSIQTDKNAEAAFAEGIGDWSSGIDHMGFLSEVLKGHGTALNTHSNLPIFFFFWVLNVWLVN